MEQRKLRFALFGNIYQAKKSVSIQKILSLLSERKAEVLVEREFYNFLKDGQRLEMNVDGVIDNDQFSADFVVSMGGDGTLLCAANHVGNKQIPIVGVNMGRLGFLADVSPNEIEQAFDDLYRGEYTVEPHSTIQVSDSHGELNGALTALNDIAVLKRDSASMISIRTYINGEYLVTYQADGLIVSTPTGSTAYSLSNGGPIIVAQTPTLCLTPVAPHSLNVRPIVINDNATVTLKVESRNHNFLVAIDGRSEKCKEGTVLTIKKAAYNIGIVKRNSSRYFATLREKMSWGLDVR